MKPYLPDHLPLPQTALDYSIFLNELLDATSQLAVYREKIADSKLDSSWFLPTLQQKEALASTKLEGTQATLDGVLLNQIEPKDDDMDLNEVTNYLKASALGLTLLGRNGFSNGFFYQLHTVLFAGNVRRREKSKIGAYRTQPLVRTAIVHAQLETIHPFDDGNGRIGRMLIPLYLYYMEQISLPCFFISEALESDKFKYYSLLNGTRTKGDWNSWIKFFLETVSKQCRKYIYIIAKINHLYESHLDQARSLVNSSNIGPIIDVIYRHPVLDAETVIRETELSLATTNRFLNLLVENGILYTDGKRRNRKFFCYELLELLRV